MSAPNVKKNTGIKNIDNQLFINGNYRRSDNVFEKIDPVTGASIGVTAEASAQDVDDAVLAARQALKGPWKNMPQQQRLNLLYDLAAEIERRFDEFLQLECLDTGKPFSLAKHIDIPRGAANFRVFADTIKNLSSECFHTDTPDGRGAHNYAVHKPKGVIAVVCPWNLPLLLMTWKVAPALACGNTVVVKPSEETGATACLLGEVMNTVGIPPGVFNVVTGQGASVGDALISHPQVDAITFTGSTATGSKLMQKAALYIKDVSLELGGKNPGLIFADADMDKTIEGCLRAAFANCGQVCLGTERLYVQRPLFDEFVERMVAGAKSYRFGRPEAETTNMGPMVSARQKEKVLSYYERAREEGATVLCGGGVPAVESALQNGNWIEPTLWTGLPETSPVITDEIFGPCAHIAPFDDEEEAIVLANDTRYGLCATVWTENSARAHRVSQQLDAGIVWANCWFLRDLRTPFGGAKQSGIGREGGVHSLEFYTETSNICLKL